MINRRDFLKKSSMTAAPVAAGQLPLWATNTQGECYAVEGFANLLKQYQLPKTVKGASTLSYKLYSQTTDLGMLTVTRKRAQQLSCNYSTFPPSDCQGEFIFKGALMAGLDSWELTSTTTTVQLCKDWAPTQKLEKWVLRKQLCESVVA